MLQTFTNQDLSGLIEKHKNAIDYLQSIGLKLKLQDTSKFRDGFVKSVRSQVEEQNKIPFYLVLQIFISPLQSIRFANKSIEYQEKNGMISSEIFKN